MLAGLLRITLWATQLTHDTGPPSRTIARWFYTTDYSFGASALLARSVVRRNLLAVL